jgi:putative membrane protein
MVLPSDAETLLTAAAAWRWWGVALAALLILPAVSLGAWIVGLFGQSWLLGGLAVTALVALLGGAGTAIYLDLSSFRRFREATNYQQLFAEDVPADKADAQRAALIGLLNDLPITAEQAATVTEAVRECPDNAHAIDIVERLVVRDLDNIALVRVRTGVLHSFGLIALSPTSITDTALFVWRALRLMREVAAAYGLRPNRVSSLWLLRQVLSDAALITAADLASDALSTVLGDKLAARLSSPLAEGSLASYRMARFGLLAIQRCRPIALRRDDKLGLFAILRSRSTVTDPASSTIGPTVSSEDKAGRALDTPISSSQSVTQPQH